MISVFLASWALATTPPLSGDCKAVDLAHTRGQLLRPEHVIDVACDADRAVAPVVFDRQAQHLRAGADLAAGAYLGAINVPDEQGFLPGEPLTLRIVIGPITVERLVWAAQASHGHEHIFVRDDSGTAFPARVEALSRSVVP